MWWLSRSEQRLNVTVPGMRGHRIATAIAAAAVVLTAGLSAAPTAQASVNHRKATVGETVFRHHKYRKLRATYAVRPSTIALLEPDKREVISLHWSAWSAGSAKGSGFLKQAGGCGCGVPARVLLSRVRSGHFTRMRVYPQTSPHSPMVFRWLGTAKANSAKLWQAKA
jgi:hypothetical protein